MTDDPRAALSALVTALERHLEAAAARRGENDPTVVAAYRDVADAFETYDDSLMDTYGEVTPLEIYAGDDEFEDDEDESSDDEDDYDLDEDDDDDGAYGGLDDEDYDTDDEPATTR
ncbi:hypothetical protein PZ938_12950 [Luteipulveratus sp. YIM 133132]|uniref:Primosomal protein n=1 Tax=Luteipulveratus flavus TaxID=3031728 RepID=A0ABT6CBY9_9MICO|nr:MULTISPECIES: hypothetical protein [unclassified Luteipulveratus]MDE9366513.1 hypothetical protein [Luteipulveratus sp. YIM 133132]MDF8265892.1 hypothetical protein [Luteipulveratus sp. YIM 133296]